MNLILRRKMQTFADIPTVPEATRYQHYSHRIRYLNHDDDVRYRGKPDSKLSKDVFVHLFHLLPPTPQTGILPKLEFLTWRTTFIHYESCFLPFVGPNLKNLHVVIRATQVRRIQQVLRALNRLRPKMLKAIRLNLGYDNFRMESRDALDVDLAACLASLPGLQSVVLDDTFLRPPTLDGLRQNANIYRIVANVSPELEWTPFPEPVQQIAKAFPKLVDLSLHCMDLNFHFTSVAALLDLHSLLHLRLVGIEPMGLTSADIQLMGAAWPKLRTLAILCEIRIMGEGVPITQLRTFAEAFANAPLKQLATQFTFDEEMDTSVGQVVKLRDLEVLGVGNSTVPQEKIQMVAELVASICVPGVCLSSIPEDRRLSWDELYNSPPQYGWEKVSTLVQMAHRVHLAHYSSRIR